MEQHVRADLISRLHALSRAHDVLVDNNWAGADLGQIVTDAVAAYDAGAGRIRIDGPMVRLHPSQAVTLALVLHELATNAAKYGALSLPTSGCVTISWNEALDAGGARQRTFCLGPAEALNRTANDGPRRASGAGVRSSGRSLGLSERLRSNRIAFALAEDVQPIPPQNRIWGVAHRRGPGAAGRGHVEGSIGPIEDRSDQ